MRFAATTLLFSTIALHAANVFAGGLARSPNFVVMAPDQPLAEQLLDEAERLRTTLAQEWFGRPIPPSIGATVIHLELSDGPHTDSGLFWAIDDQRRKYHKLWLETSRERALGSTLRHELTHMVFASRFQPRLPAWVEEGAASLQDDGDRKAVRADLLAWFVETRNWPRLSEVLRQEKIAADDVAAYSVAASLAEYLLTIDDKQTFVRFAQLGLSQGWDRAVADCYRLSNLDALQADWQVWVAERAGSTATSRKISGNGDRLRAALLPLDTHQRPKRQNARS